MQNRGLSDIVTTVLLILAAIAAVAIVWAFLQPILKNSSISTAAYTSEFSVPSSSVNVDPNASIATVSVKRDAGQGDMVGVVFGLQGIDGTIKTFRQNVTLNELEMKNFAINYSGYNLSNIVQITVTPIFRNNATGQDVLGTPITQQVTNVSYSNATQGQQQPLGWTMPTGLVAQWKFNGDFTDSSGNGLTLTPVGSNIGFNTTTNLGSNSLYNKLWASSSYASIADTPVLDTPSFSVVSWVYLLPQIPPSTYASNNLIMGKYTVGQGFYLGYSGTASAWQCVLYGLDTLNLSDSSPGGTWKFVATTYDSSTRNLSIYVNNNYNSTIVPAVYVPSTVTAKIAYLYLGNMNNLMYFNRALSPSEIQGIQTNYAG